jgi:hypothetical protein
MGCTARDDFLLKVVALLGCITISKVATTEANGNHGIHY